MYFSRHSTPCHLCCPPQLSYTLSSSSPPPLWIVTKTDFTFTFVLTIVGTLLLLKRIEWRFEPRDWSGSFYPTTLMSVSTLTGIDCDFDQIMVQQAHYSIHYTSHGITYPSPWLHWWIVTHSCSTHHLCVAYWAFTHVISLHVALAVWYIWSRRLIIVIRVLFSY